MISSLILLGTAFQDSALHQFIFLSEPSARSVSVAGTFNNWDRNANPMKVDADGRTWRLSLNLAFGKHQYKFVRNGEEWMVDPKAKKNVDDGNGNTNSELIILPNGYDKSAAKRDNQVTKGVVFHDQSLRYLNFDRGLLKFTLRTRTNDVNGVRLVTKSDQKSMKLSSSDELFDYFSCSIPWDGKSNFKYQFLLDDTSTTLNTNETARTSGFEISTKTVKKFETPHWVQDTVFYQIFPDRFNNGSKTNDPKEVVVWNGTPTYSNRFGGDSIGVEQKIPYLKDLGISTIYFNPIFKSPSNHRYEADSFEKVDPEFGTNEEYYRLSKSLKKNGIRTVLDFAFNHTSPNFNQFMDLRKNGEKSPFRNWYFIKSFPIQVGTNPNYEAWYGFPSMPKLNTVNPDTTKHLLNVCNFWMSNSNLDGMRLDVANEVDMAFWRKMRPYVKAKNPDLWIVGEIWGDGNPWLQGDQFDSVMNYQFRNAIINFVAKGNWKASQFVKDLQRVQASYPPQVNRNLMNLIGSHDTPRFLNECGMDQDLALLGATLQFTWIGSPSIYYGDEIGMEGGADPLNRKGMDWSKVTADNPFLRTYKTLIQSRKSIKALTDGDATFQSVDDLNNTGVFTRVSDQDAAIVAFNRSDKEQKVSFNVSKNVRKYASKGLFNIFTGNRIAISNRPVIITLKPKSATVLTSKQTRLSSPAPRQSRFAVLAIGDSDQRRANLKSRSQIAK
jgi:cyclomaltodextrinase / maltogenic alpha-amylase / neopullulanase